MSKTCAQRKKERDRDRQRNYVGCILMDNRTLYKEMTLCGFPVSVSLSEATSGKSQKWEEEKQAYLNCEKVSIAEAIHHFGSDVILDLATRSVSKADEPAVLPSPQIQTSLINVRKSTGTIVSSTSSEQDVVHLSTQFEVPHAQLGSKSRRVKVTPVAAEDVCDLPTVEEDTLMVADQHGYLGSFLETLDDVKIPKSNDGCSDFCKIPIEVLNVMVRDDPKLALQCQLIRKTLRCVHLDGLQIIERPDVPVYNMQTITIGKVANERGFKYHKYFSSIKTRNSRRLSDTTWHYLQTLSNPGIAARALGYIMRYSQHPGRKTKILYNWNSGAPKHELFPIRFSS